MSGRPPLENPPVHQRPALASAINVLAKVPDATDRAWLQVGLQKWIDSRGSISLESALGLPPASRTTIAIRDFWLSAGLIECDGRVTKLHRECRRFERFVWPVWQDLHSAPSSASRIEKTLFYALRAAPFPGRRRLAKILAHIGA